MTVWPPVLTPEGRARLEGRRRMLVHAVLPDLEARYAAEDRSAADLVAYLGALTELFRLETVLGAAVDLAEREDDPYVVEVGDMVTLEVADGSVRRLRIVDPAEAVLGTGTSALDPLATAVLGRRIGDLVGVPLPGGVARVLGATRPAYAAA